jgi:C-terminal processing protease CtpA/Prc
MYPVINVVIVMPSWAPESWKDSSRNDLRTVRPGDVIEQVNRKPVTDVAGLKAAVKASGDKPSLFLVTRKGGSLYLAVEPPRA